MTTRYALSKDQMGRALLGGAIELGLIPELGKGQAATVETIENGGLITVRTMREIVDACDEAPMAAAPSPDAPQGNAVEDPLDLARRRISELELEATDLTKQLAKVEDTVRQHWAAYVGADAQMRAAQERERVAHQHRARAEKERVAAEERCRAFEELFLALKKAIKGVDTKGTVLGAEQHEPTKLNSGVVICKNCGLVQELWNEVPGSSCARSPKHPREMDEKVAAAAKG